MPTFTLELWRVSEMTGGHIGLDDYPIFDPDYRAGLNQKISDHYHNREIGLETSDLFIFHMRRKMNEIMPLYNQLYLSERLNYDPLSTIDLKTVTSGVTSMDSSGTSTSTTSQGSDGISRAVQSQFPQVRLSGNEDYASSASDTTSNSTATGSGTEESSATNSQDSSGDSHVTGYQGHTAELIMAYRRSLMNIDLMIIDELNELFMNVWDNGDDYLPVPLTPLTIGGY